MDRASGSGPEGRGFKSLRARRLQKAKLSSSDQQLGQLRQRDLALLNIGMNCPHPQPFSLHEKGEASW